MLNKYGANALEKIHEAKDRAESAGKTKVTAKHASPDVIFNKAIKKSAKPMFAVITEIAADPGYQNLSSDVRGKLNQLLITLSKE